MAKWFYRLSVALVLVMFFSAFVQAGQKKKLLLLGQGPDGHKPTTHEYMTGLRILAKTLQDIPDLEVAIIKVEGDWLEGPDLIKDADAVVLYLAQGAKWIHANPRRLEAFALLAARGRGLVGLHWGIGAKDKQYIDGYLKLWGGCHGGPDRKYQILDAIVEIADPKHAITSGINNFEINDEFYYKLKFVKPEGAIRPIIKAKIDGRKETVSWAWERPDGGRSFGFSGGHFHRNWRQVEYRRLVAQGVLWTLKMPIPEAGLPAVVDENDLKLDQGSPSLLKQ